MTLHSVLAYMRRKRLTYEAFGAKIGVDRVYCHHLLHGKRKLSTQRLRDIHEVTKISPKRLLHECTQKTDLPALASIRGEGRSHVVGLR
jgi:hypothetical protein